MSRIGRWSLGLIGFILVCQNLQYVSCEDESEEVQLVHDLLGRSKDKAHRLARPVKNVNDVIRVRFGLSLVQIVDVDEKNQIITINVWKHMKWQDEFATWNSSNYGGIDKIILPHDALWTPDIVLYDNMERRDLEIHKEKIILRSDGEVEWVPYVIYRSACSVDMTNFPFDTQNCSFKFGSWSYTTKQLDLIFENDVEDFSLEQKSPSIEWAVEDTFARKNKELYNCCPPEEYVDLTFYLVISRRSGFFMKFMVFPVIILTCLALAIFWIPPARADRTGLGTSVLASFMFLLILVTQISPPSHVIKFITYICCNMGMVAVAVIYSVCMVNISMWNVPMSATTRKIFIDSLAPCFLCLPKSTKKSGA